MAARIRSIHPGFFTDEQLVECSHAARLLLIGLLTECDDQGVFEWKPKRLKMTLFPAEDLPLAPLLKELEVANAIRRYAVDGKDYGAVRNFRKFQRPQKPNDIYPRTPEIDDYVGPKHKRKGGARSSEEIDGEAGLFGDGRSGGDYRTGSDPGGGQYDTGSVPEGDQYDTGTPSRAAEYDTDPPSRGAEYDNDPPPGTPRVRESAEQMEEGGGRKKPHHGVSSPSSRDSAPVDAGRAREEAEIAKWQPRLDGYRPWEAKTAWSPGWGPRPDSAGRNPFIPESLLKPWREDWQAALSQRPAGVAVSAAGGSASRCSGSGAKAGADMAFQEKRQEVEVRTNLDELVEIDQVGMKRRSYRRRAATRIITIERHGEAFLDLPDVGDLWCPLTVRARLERMGESYRRLPEIKLREHPLSCMPEVVRERWKDEPKEQRRRLTDRALDDADMTAANQVVDVLTMEQRPIAWAIAEKKSDRWLGKRLGVHNMTAAKRKEAMLEALAHHWNALIFRPDAGDVARVRGWFHKNIGKGYSLTP